MLCLALFVLPSVESQSYVTSTTQVPSTQLGTYTAGSSVLVSILQPQLVMNRSFTVYSTTGTSVSCETASFTFNGTRGQYVSGNLTSNIAVGFYIMADATYQSWSKLGNCGSVPGAIESQQSTMAYDFTVALPDSGIWDIVLVNSSNARNASGFLMAYLTSGTFISTTSLLSTVTQTIPVESAIIIQGEATVSNYSLYLIAGIIAIVFVIVLTTSGKILKKKRTTS